MRTIDVTGGEKKYLVGLITEKTGKSLETATFQVGLGTRTTPPTTWSTPDTKTVTGPKASISLLVDSTDQLGARQTLWVRVTDNPEVYDLACSNDNVTVT